MTKVFINHDEYELPPLIRGRGRYKNNSSLCFAADDPVDYVRSDLSGWGGDKVMPKEEKKKGVRRSEFSYHHAGSGVQIYGEAKPGQLMDQEEARPAKKMSDDKVRLRYDPIGHKYFDQDVQNTFEELYNSPFRTLSMEREFHARHRKAELGRPRASNLPPIGSPSPMGRRSRAENEEEEGESPSRSSFARGQFGDGAGRGRPERAAPSPMMGRGRDDVRGRGRDEMGGEDNGYSMEDRGGYGGGRSYGDDSGRGRFDGPRGGRRSVAGYNDGLQQRDRFDAPQEEEWAPARSGPNRGPPPGRGGGGGGGGFGDGGRGPERRGYVDEYADAPPMRGGGGFARGGGGGGRARMEQQEDVEF